MLCAYYDCTCKSDDLFKNFEIASSDNYNEHLNKYNVIYLDIAGFISDVRRRNGNIRAIANEITDVIRSELIADRPELKDKTRVSECMIAYVKATKKIFVFIIDEWDAVIREANM